jgi:hypothetical protein
MSGALQFETSWKEVLSKAALSGSPNIFITRLPLVSANPFVFRQYAYGSCWLTQTFTQQDISSHLAHHGYQLRREFFLEPEQKTWDSPSTWTFWGLWFSVSTSSELKTDETFLF